MRTALLITALMISLISRSQDCELVIYSTDSVKFELLFDDVPATANDTNRVHYASVQCGVHKVLIRDTDGNMMVETEIELPEFTSNYFQLVPIGNKRTIALEKRQSNEMPIDIFPESASGQVITHTLVTEDVIIDPAEAIEDSIPRYQGRTGCTGPATSRDLQQMQHQLESMYFEEERYETLLDLSQYYCLKVTQMMNLISLISFDDRKLSLLKASADRIYEQDQLQQLSVVFELSHYRSEWEQFLLSREP